MYACLIWRYKFIYAVGNIWTEKFLWRFLGLFVILMSWCKEWVVLIAWFYDLGALVNILLFFLFFKDENLSEKSFFLLGQKLWLQLYRLCRYTKGMQKTAQFMFQTINECFILFSKVAVLFSNKKSFLRKWQRSPKTFYVDAFLVWPKFLSSNLLNW